MDWRYATAVVAVYALSSGFAAPVCLGDSPTCTMAATRLTEDYTFIVGSADYGDADGDPESGSYFRWLVNGLPAASGGAGELLFLNLDDSTEGGGGETPTAAEGVTFEAGRWGSALALQPSGSLRFERQGNLDLNEGTIEMWIAPRANGNDPVYSERSHHLFQYIAPDGDFISITQDGDTGVLFAGGTVHGQWQTAYNSAVTTRDWSAGDWHHLAYTFSQAGNFMRLYIDGSWVADTNEGHYHPPSGTGNEFFIGSDAWSNEAYYLIDAVRVTSRIATQEEIVARSQRRQQPQPFEFWLATAALQDGDVAMLAFTPSGGGDMGIPCVSEPLTYPGIPIVEPDPPSTILRPNTTHLTLSVRSNTATQCKYALGDPLDYDAMTPFDTGAGSTLHETVISGIDPDANVVTHVYVRSGAYPDFAMHLQYRCLSEVNPSFPRTANLWGSWMFIPQGMAYASRIDLWLGANFSPNQIRTLRTLNPDTRVLTSISAVEQPGLPEDYYLHDIDGNRVEVWPGMHRLNLTRPYVAEHQAALAYQRIVSSELMFDGCFFDNVMTTQSWQDHDIFGRPFLYDYNEDGVVDDPEEFDAAWKAGVFHEINTFRELMPNALITGHSMNIFEPGIADAFNGIGIGFMTANVIEGLTPFGDLWNRLEAWHTLAVAPHITMVESSPPNQIAYGYGYAPWADAPESTPEFARTYYPYVRFGLVLTLMHDGFFAHEFGDTWHGNDWWYDELDFDLGQPLGAARFVNVGDQQADDLIVNGGFELPIEHPWHLWINEQTSTDATLSRDPDDAAEGEASARVDISAASGEVWDVTLTQLDRPLTAGTEYIVTFRAKANSARTITLSAQRGEPPWGNLGFWEVVAIGTEWRECTVSFTAGETAADARIQFMFGEMAGSVWLDDVHLRQYQPHLLRRDFTHGIALLNPEHEPLSIDLEPGYRRLTGSQAPRWEYLSDDGDATFSTTGNWTEKSYDSGVWQATGPYYHNWRTACRESGGLPGDTARWSLTIPEADTYTIAAWWPAAPSSNAWSANVAYEVVAGGVVVASATVNQREGGDTWNAIAQNVFLAPTDDAYVRVYSQDGNPCVADALHVRSSARYNDGSPAPSVTLQAMDGIILERYAGDFDADGDADGCDFSQFASCFSGPGVAYAAGCAPGDFDIDGDIDCNDWALFVQTWDGPPIEPPPFPPCAVGIPTLTHWSLLTLALLLNVAATVIFGSRMATRLAATRRGPLPYGRR